MKVIGGDDAANAALPRPDIAVPAMSPAHIHLGRIGIPSCSPLGRDSIK